jgi:hypothetical protein
MAVQQWTIMKIVGPAADDAAARMERWRSARRAEYEGSSDELPEATRREVTRYLRQLAAHRFDMPVAYFSRHVDLWLAGGQEESHLPKVLPSVRHDEGELWAYQLPDRGRLVRRNEMLVRKAQFPEGAWLARRLLEAAAAYRTLWPATMILIDRQAVAASPDDGDLKVRAAHLPEWLGATTTDEKS